MEKADTTAYSTARITGDYAFGAAGLDNAIIARDRRPIDFEWDRHSHQRGGDVNAVWHRLFDELYAANYTVSNTATGRGTIHFDFTFGGNRQSKFRFLRREFRKVL